MILKVWKIAAITLTIAAILGGLWGLTIYGRYWDVLPRSPDASSGRIYPFGMRGITVYETLQEHKYLDYIETLSSAAFYAGFALALAYEWKSGELRRYFRGEVTRTDVHR